MHDTILKKSLAFISAALLLPAVPLSYAQAEDALTDSGISYKELPQTMQNPAAGYTTTVWAKCAPNKTDVYSPTGSLVLFFIDIGGFSGGANGTTDDSGKYTPGKDYDLDKTFFDSWRQTLDNCRKNGSLVGLRFRYDANGKDDPEPATFDKVLAHIKQIKDSKLLDDYRDIIVMVESGFVGKWGEQHGGKYTSVEYKAKLLNALVEAVPESIPITVRTPDTFAEWAGIKRNQLNDSKILADAADNGNDKVLSTRIGMYNDGYMGSNSDLGTFADRTIETDWLNRVAEHTYYGGEFSGNIEFAKQYDTYLPENCIPEMYKTHLSYINGNIFGLYKDMEYTEKYAVEGADNSAYYGQSVFQFIRDHIGYRFIVRDSKLTANAKQGDIVKLRFSVENTGFANIIPHTDSYIILEKDGVYICAYADDIEPNSWKSCTTTENSLDLRIPDNISEGKWNIYLKTTVGGYRAKPDSMTLSSVRFANEGTWNASLGANLLGTVDIAKSDKHGTDDRFRPMREHDNANGSTEYYYSNATPVTDGAVTFDGEWTEDMEVAKNDSGQSISVRADENFLYVMSKMPTGADAPVYNIQLKNPHSGENYWMYYASNGFIYFNHETRGESDCKWSGDTVEFRLPLDVFGLEAGDVIDSLRVFLQDSGNDWKVMGDITASKVTVSPDITVYTAEKDIRLKEGDMYTFRVDSPVEGLAYQWLKDGEPVEKANEAMLHISDVTADTKGEYSVKLTAENGVERIVPVANVLEVTSDTEKELIAGDANCDGGVDLSDAVLIMQFIANPDKYGRNGSEPKHITEQGELNGDVSGNNDGLTARDALAVQKYMLKLIDKLPEPDNTDK
ncbi:MAG: DUF4832 domain-containing protein [Ruminococcus sp.]|nr:DUF4832 domain-containing protein [Ruminococcus sp.]